MQDISSSRRIENIISHLRPSHGPSTSLSLQSCSQSKRFTFKSGLLTDKERDFYEENGYIVVKRLVPEDLLDKYRKHFLDIANGVTKPVLTMTVMRDVMIAKRKEMGEKAITKLQDWQDDELLFSYCQLPEVLDYVECIIGPNIKTVHTMLINKPSDLGQGSSRHPPHQDLWYFPFRPADKIVAAWTAMQHIDRNNGCLFVKPGSHKGELYDHDYPKDGIVNKAYHGIQGMSSEEDTRSMILLEMEPGDTVFFHPLLIHGSGRNNTSGFRKAISCHFASSDCQFIEVKGTLQEKIAMEVEGMIKNRGLESIPFNDVWRMKMRLARGEEKTLI